MPGRLTPLVTEQFYHIYNRGSEKRNIFTQLRDYSRFQKTFYYYQFLGPKPSFSKFSKSDLNFFKPNPDRKIVDVICYCLMPNHFHFLLRQLKENGISIFIGQLSNSYTKYFNTKYKRVGPLLQGAFKAVLIETEEQLVHLSRYIHLNPVVSGLAKNLGSYHWSSYTEYMSGQKLYCSPEEILSLYPTVKSYREFVEAQIKYGTSLEILKHRIIDEDI